MIAISLPVHEPHPPPNGPGGLLAGPVGRWPLSLATVTTFLSVAVVWLNLKTAFRRIRPMDRGLRWANPGLLFTVARSPLPTAVVATATAIRDGSASDGRTAVGFYGLFGVVLGASWFVFVHHLCRHPGPAEEAVDGTFFAKEWTRAPIGCALHAVRGRSV